MKKPFLTLDLDGHDLDRKNILGLSYPFPLPPSLWEFHKKHDAGWEIENALSLRFFWHQSKEPRGGKGSSGKKVQQRGG